MSRLARAWYAPPTPWLRALLPLAGLFACLARRRREQYRQGRRPVYHAPVPVIVVGNISAGGTGKTPLVAWLAERLREQGLRPGIVSRGYGSRAPRYPYGVSPDSPPAEAGDEALLLARATGCPVVIAPDRGAAARHLLATQPCDLILSDDGLQHYGLARDVEIAVVDGRRGLGNGWLLPAGPLREPPARLLEVDFVVGNGGMPEDVRTALHAAPGANPPSVHVMNLRPKFLRNLKTGRQREAEGQGERVHAVAGIGNPQRFFDTLRGCGFAIIPSVFRDHHAFQPSDLTFPDALPIVMTEKDAVKCQAFADERCWYLKVEASLPQSFFPALLSKLHAAPAPEHGLHEHG